MRAWEDFDAFPTGDVRRFQLAQRIIEDACRRLPSAKVFVASDVRREDGGWSSFGRQGWAFFLTIDVIGGRVRAALDQLFIENGHVRGIDGSFSTERISVLESRPLLTARLRRHVQESKKARAADQQWFGELTETWAGMWRDQSFQVLDEFVDPRRGLLWDNMPPTPEWQPARWAWLAFHSPLRNPVHVGDRRLEYWELPEGHAFRERLHRPHARWIGRKWPDSKSESEHEYEAEELERALRILEESRRNTVAIDPTSIPLAALARPEGVNIQQRVLHYLLLDANGPHMKAARIAEVLGFQDPRDVRKAAKACQKKMDRA